MFGALELGKANVKSLAPTLVPLGNAGKAFGYVATVMRLGEIVGGLIGPRLYMQSTMRPMFTVAMTLMAAAGIIGWTTPGGIKQRESPPPTPREHPAMTTPAS